MKMNKILILAVLLLSLGAGSSFDNKAFYIPFLTKNNYNAALDESLDPDVTEDNATEFYNGSDY